MLAMTVEGRRGDHCSDVRAQQAAQLGGVEAVATYNGAVQKKDGYVESMAALQDGVAVDIDYFDGRERQRAAERFQLAQHFIAQLTVVAVDHGKTGSVQRINDGGRPVRNWL